MVQNSVNGQENNNYRAKISASDYPRSTAAFGLKLLDCKKYLSQTLERNFILDSRSPREISSWYCDSIRNSCLFASCMLLWGSWLTAAVLGKIHFHSSGVSMAWCAGAPVFSAKWRVLCLPPTHALLTFLLFHGLQFRFQNKISIPFINYSYRQTDWAHLRGSY